jgi:hypothetical protein
METQNPEDIPNEPITAFHITGRDRKKAIRVRALLAMDAPADVGPTIRNVPIKVMPKIQKNRMLAITGRGVPLLEINLKSGQISFVPPPQVAP